MMRLCDEYKSRIIPGLWERVSSEGRQPDVFPYSFLNVLRMFVNYAEYYFRDFYDLYVEARDSIGAEETLAATLGSPTRMLRYCLVLVLGAYLDTTLSDTDKIAFLEELAQIAQRKVEARSQLDVETVARVLDTFANSDFHPDLRTKRLTSQLAILAREYVDYLFLGEHPLSFETFLPITANRYHLVVRRFGSLGYGGFTRDLHTLEVQELYQIDVPAFSFNLFSGSLRGMPPFRDKTAVAVYVNDDRVEGLTQLLAILDVLERSLDLVVRRYSALSMLERELEAARSYSLELVCLATRFGKEWNMSFEAREAILSSSRANRLLLERDKSDVGELYLGLCQDAIEWLLMSQAMNQNGEVPLPL